MKQISPTTDPALPHSVSGNFRGRGFTLIEMIVAIAVLSLMISLASRMFFDASRVVSGGMQTSQIIAHARTLSDQLLKDARQMHVFESGTGSNSPGFLVIVQQAYPGVRFPPVDKRRTDPSGWLADADGDGVVESAPNFDDWIRSDQIAFFRDADGLESITPGQNDRFDSLARASHARVWMGHTWPADLPRSLGNGTTAPGEPHNGPGDVGFDAFAPRYDLATELTLGRQAMLLVENNVSTVWPGGRSGDISSGSGPRGRAIAPLASLPMDQAAAAGLSDVASLLGYKPTAAPAVFVYDDGGTDPAAPNKAAMFRTPGWDQTTAFVNPSLMDSMLTVTGTTPEWNKDDRLTTKAYAEAAMEWTYARPGGRLAASALLPENYANGIFTADQIGQLHGSFIPHVADFAIEFAADLVDDFGPDSNGNIVHVSQGGQRDGMPDNRPDVDANGDIKWYNNLNPNPDSNNDGIADDPTKPMTWPMPRSLAAFDGNIGAVVNVNTIVRPLNTLAGYAGPTTNAQVFVFAHSGDDPDTDETTVYAPIRDYGGANATHDPGTRGIIEGSGKYWPYLIRYRYRLMDAKGEYRSTDPVTGAPIVGRWFEQIVPVPRPTGIF